MKQIYNNNKMSKNKNKKRNNKNENIFASSFTLLYFFRLKINLLTNKML